MRISRYPLPFMLCPLSAYQTINIVYQEVCPSSVCSKTNTPTPVPERGPVSREIDMDRYLNKSRSSTRGNSCSCCIFLTYESTKAGPAEVRFETCLRNTSLKVKGCVAPKETTLWATTLDCVLVTEQEYRATQCQSSTQKISYCFYQDLQ